MDSIDDSHPATDHACSVVAVAGAGSSAVAVVGPGSDSSARICSTAADTISSAEEAVAPRARIALNGGCVAILFFPTQSVRQSCERPRGEHLLVKAKNRGLSLRLTSTCVRARGCGRGVRDDGEQQRRAAQQRRTASQEIANGRFANCRVGARRALLQLWNFAM